LLGRLATAHAAGILRNHPFVDGNMRTGLIIANVFLLDNGHDTAASDADLLRMIAALADGSATEAQFSDWLRTTLVVI